MPHEKLDESAQTIDPDEELWKARAAAAAESTLGDPERAERWLHKKNRALAGEAPVELLVSEAGFKSVMDVLLRIEHGIPS